MVTDLNLSSIPMNKSDPLLLTWSYTDNTGVPVSRFIIHVEANGTDQCRSTGDVSLRTANPPTQNLMISYAVPTFEFIWRTSYTVRVTAENLLGEGGEATLTFETREVWYDFVSICPFMKCKHA